MLQGSQGGPSEKGPIIERTSFIIKLALYDIMSKSFDDLKTTLTSIDNRLRNVETDIWAVRVGAENPTQAGKP